MIFAAVSITTLVTILFMLALRPIAIATGFVDKPGGHKRHVGEVPIIGGAAMFLGVAIGMQLLDGLGSEYSLFLVAGGLLVGIGLIDDRLALTTSVRLIAQLVAVLILSLGAGLVMTDIGDPFGFGRIQLGPLGLIVTTLIFVSVINAYNLIDGLDGLAGSMALIAVLSIVAVSIPGSPAQSVALVFAGAVSGYLVFNFPVYSYRPFRAFMGDAGSTFLGLSVVCVTVTVCQGPERVISPVHGLWFAAVPIYGLFTCFVLRLLRGVSPFHAQHDHFHDVLLHAGMGPRQTVATLIASQLAYTTVGIVCVASAVPEAVVFTMWSILGVAQYAIIKCVARVYSRIALGQAAV